MNTGALDGTHVLEIGTSGAVAFAARLLADHGADVAKVERRGGGDVAGRRGVAAGMRQFLDWNKRSAAVEVGPPDEKPSFAALLRWADVVFVGLTPGEVRRHGLTAGDIERHNPRAVVVHLTAFGLTGPYADYAATDLVLQAMSGMMAISGSAGRPPLKHGVETATYTAGLNAAYAAVAALLSVDRSGHGVNLDLAVRDCLTSELVMNNAFHAFTRVVQSRPPRIADPLDGNPVHGAAGHLSLQTSARQPIARIGRFFDDPRFADDAFATSERRVANATALTSIIRDHLGVESARELFVRGSDEGLVIGFVQGAGELLDCPHLADREVYADLADGWRLPAVLGALSRTPTSVRTLAPEPGRHTAGLLVEAGFATAPARSEAPPSAAGPLTGLRVVDLSVIFAVPYLGALLADLGAEVIKVEAPTRMDQTRTDWGGYIDNDPGEDPWNRSGTFHVVNRGKRSLTLDLSTAEGRAVLRRLVAQSDVLLDNFTPRVLPKWGMTHDELATENPALITLSNTGYGSTGPWSSYKAQGTTLEATMGLMSVTGYADGGPTRAGQSVPDFYACWAGLLAVCAALRHRSRTGEGQHVDLGMYQLGLSVIPEALVHRQVHGEDVPRVGSRDHRAVFSAVVPTRGTDRWLAVSASTADQYDALVRVVGSGGERPGLSYALRNWASRRTAHDAAEELQVAGVPAGPVNDAADLADDPQLEWRGFYEPVDVPAAGGCRDVIGRPYTWISAGSSVGIRRAAPDFGADNDHVLMGTLGLDQAEVDRLTAAGIVSDRPLDPPAAHAMDVDLLLATGTLSRVMTRAEA